MSIYIMLFIYVRHTRDLLAVFILFIFLWGRTHFTGYLSCHWCPTRGCEVIANYLIPYHAYCIHWFK